MYEDQVSLFSIIPFLSIAVFCFILLPLVLLGVYHICRWMDDKEYTFNYPGPHHLPWIPVEKEPEWFGSERGCGYIDTAGDYSKNAGLGFLISIVLDINWNFAGSLGLSPVILPSIVITTTLIIFLSRKIIRLSKAFSRHVADKDVHK